MKPTPPDSRWETLARLARETEPGPAADAPFGFAARVVAQAFARRRELALFLWQRWSWRAALFSATAAVTLGFFAAHRTPPPRLDVPEPVLEVPALQWP